MASLLNISGRALVKMPYDSEVEYLQSSGTQYIDTGVDYDSSVIVNARLMFLESVASTAFGIYYNDGTARRWQLMRATKNAVYAYFNTVTNKSLSSIASNAWHYVGADNRYLNVSASSVDSGASTFSTSTPVSIYVFGRHNGSSMDSPAKIKLSKMQIYKGSTLVRDFVPVRKSGVGYLYDRVSGQLFGNLGTGSFTYGNDVPTTYDSEVEYLQSTGTQWIDTGIIPQEGDELEIKLKQTTVKDQAPFGLALVMYCFGNGNSNTSGTYWAYPPNAGGASGVNPLGDQNWHIIKMSTSGVYVDATQLGSITASTSSPLNTLALFGRKNNSATLDMAKLYTGMIEYFKYKRNGVLIADYIPVMAGQVGYMYDKVSGQLFGNAGTGDFILGNDI